MTADDLVRAINEVGLEPRLVGGAMIGPQSSSLSISRSIIEAHGGRLWATANQPHGAVYQSSLPVVEPPP